MADPDLNESAWQKAKQDGASAYTTTAFWIGAALMGLLFAAAALALSDGDSAATQAGASIFFGVLAITVTLGFVFVVQLAAAPVRQRNELRFVSNASRTPPISFKVALNNAHRRGNDLHQRLAAMETTPSRPDEELAEKWADEVVALIAMNAPDASTEAFIAAGGSEAGAVNKLRARVETLERVIAD